MNRKSNLDDSSWTDLAPDVTASGLTASKSDPLGPEQRFYRVLALEQDDKPQEAVSALEKAKALKKDDPATLLGLGDLYSGNTDVKDLAKALENYEAYQKAGFKREAAVQFIRTVIENPAPYEVASR